jgi:hypothetical protein
MTTPRLTQEVKATLKNLNEIRVYAAEAKKQIPALEAEIAASLFPDLTEGRGVLNFGALTITCEKRVDYHLAPDAFDSMSDAQRDWLFEKGILIVTNKDPRIDQQKLADLPDNIKATLGVFLLPETHPPVVTIKGNQ